MLNEIIFPGLGLDFTIDRVAFSLFGLDIYWYGIIIMSGLFLAVLYAWFECEKRDFGIKTDDVFNMLIIALPVSIIFARAYYVIFSFENYRGDLSEIFNIRNGGIAIYGAVIGAFLTVFGYCKIKKISVLKTLDLLSIGLLIGQAVGRYGNFVNGEAFGSETSNILRMTVIKNGTEIANSVHPTFFYESVWNIIGIIILLFLKKFKKTDGQLICAYISWYGAGRFWIEGLRTDSLMLGDIRISQLIALVSVFVGIIGYVYLVKKTKKVNA